MNDLPSKCVYITYSESKSTLNTQLDMFMYYVKLEKMCFIRYPNIEKQVDKTRRSRVFFNDFEVFGYLMKHTFSCLIYYFLNNARIEGDKAKQRTKL